MDKKSQDRTEKLRRQIEPFASEEERRHAVENFRCWIAKLRDWDEENGWKLHIKISRRDLN